MRLWSCLRLGLMAFVVCLCAGIAFGQKSEFPDEITTEDFARTRDITAGSNVFTFKKPRYRRKRVLPATKPRPAKPQPPSSARPKSYDLPADDNDTEVWKRLGVTIWRLAAGEQSKEPARVSADARFARGDRIRLSFESPDAGYIYIFNREMYTDGTVGDPLIVFPTRLSRMGDNRISAGQVIDIPDSGQYFEIEPKSDKYAGELITVVVSPTPLRDIEVPNRITSVDPVLVNAIETKYLRAVGEYDQVGSAGQRRSEGERNVAEGRTRELTLKDPQPQTMFGVKMRPKEPMMVNIALAVK